jgi:type II secretory pathway component PulF
MMSRKWYVLVAVALVAVAIMLLIVDPALAQNATTTTTTPDSGGGGSGISHNLHVEIGAWAQALLLGVAGLVALPALAKRDMSQSLTILLIVIVVGGFVYKPELVQNVIEKMWGALAGG